MGYAGTMTEPHLRLQTARKDAGYHSATDAARAFGWNENTYRSHENAERGLSHKAATRYASAFKTSVAWLLTGEKTSGNNYIEIKGQIKRGGRIIPVDPLPARGIPNSAGAYVGFTLPAKSAGYIIASNAYEPRFEIGDILVCWERALYDKKSFKDGIITTVMGEIGFQSLVLGAYRHFYENRFEDADLGPGTMFEPVLLVLKSAAATLHGYIDATDDDPGDFLYRVG